MGRYYILYMGEIKQCNCLDFLSGLLKNSYLKAETLRKELTDVREYNITIAPRIAIISNSVDFLNKSIESYSGLFEVIPIYMGKLTFRECYTAYDIKIEGKEYKYKIFIKSYAPIDFEKCSWCGECFKVCPENAIDLDLNIDYGLCSLCKKCEQVCKDNAITIDRLESIEYDVSFIITDDKKILSDVLTEWGKVYDINELDKVFEKVGEFNVLEIVKHDNDICQYSPKLDYGCKRCIESCEYEAISTDDEGIVVNHLNCVGCGKCISVCPTGAMQNGYLKDETFVKYFQTLDLPKDIFVVLGEEEELRKFCWVNDINKLENLILLPLDPRYFNTFHYLFLFAIGASKVFILNERLKENEQIKFSNKLLEFLFKYKEFISILDNYRLNKQSELINPLKNLYKNFSFSTRRKKLAAILQFLYKESIVSNILIKDNILDIFGNVLLDKDECTLCLACVNHCKIGALVAKEEDFSLNHTPAFCIQCGICEYVCPENAIEIASGLLLADEFFSMKVLNKDEPMVCPECGKVFGNKKSYDSVVVKLKAAGLFETKGTYLNYCESCRVKKLFEEGADVR
ncbi:conserved hypothetical protein [Deferribacter desulfuricans SSM1]|uniref:4Fe-4S ferredoxin-type domain-containing protein n=2 Tax=Deferribacter TaxID=53572 RepID=D3PDX4_DEFDS|nr:conserved hypothetical protein [Deferribacter desulfuricans SSM1]